jgi:hypothetical protein
MKMMPPKIGYIVLFTICLCVGVGCLYCAISILFDPDSIKKGYILANYTNPIIRYSPSFGIGFAAITILLLPYLILKDFMSLGCNYWESSEFVKAKQTVVTFLLFAPAITFFIISFYFSNIKINNYPLFIIVLLGVAYQPFMGFYKYFKFKKDGT